MPQYDTASLNAPDTVEMTSPVTSPDDGASIAGTDPMLVSPASAPVDFEGMAKPPAVMEDGTPSSDPASAPDPEALDAEAVEAQLPPVSAGTGGAVSAAFNLASTSIGAGTLGLPFAFAQTGMVLGSTLLVLSAFGCIFTVYVLISLVNETGVATFEGLAVRAFGPKAKIAVAATVTSLLWSAACVYVFVVGSLMEPVHSVLSDNTSFPKGYWGLRIMQAVFWLLFMFPLSLFRKIDTLKYASAVAIGATAILLAAMVLYNTEELTPSESRRNLSVVPQGGIGIILALNNIKVAFSGQTTCFAIYKELGNRSVPRMTLVTVVAVMGCTLIYGLAGALGFAAFGGGVDSNILSSFPDPLNSWYIMAAFVAVAATVTLSFPLVLVPPREGILQCLGHGGSHDAPQSRRMLVSALMATGALIVGLFVPSLSLMFGIVGGISGNLIAYVFPSALALKLGWTVETHGLPRMMAVWALLVIGLVFGPVGTVTAVYDEIKAEINK